MRTFKSLDNVSKDKPQGKCNHDIVGGVVEVFVLGDAEEDQQVETKTEDKREGEEA